MFNKYNKYKRTNLKYTYIQKCITTSDVKNITERMHLWKLTLICRLLVFIFKKYSIKF